MKYLDREGGWNTCNPATPNMNAGGDISHVLTINHSAILFEIMELADVTEEMLAAVTQTRQCA